MYAIVYKADGFPICVQVAGVVPDPVVIWTTEGAAKSFIDSKAQNTGPSAISRQPSFRATRLAARFPLSTVET